ncbi:hypothetical protein HAX54_002686 [Datura stramonium]|uniref:non-specific serine/threonine protein kinase n=1 Tax=Datura stramonium TaxID=4076 RepID=A0ABS8RTL5_DATST|nr:hypothetical protein [Datura stramonium]
MSSTKPPKSIGKSQNYGIRILRISLLNGSVGIGSGSSFKEENGDGVVEIWALKIWFWVYLRKKMASSLKDELSQKTAVFGLKVWQLIGILVGIFIVVILLLLTFYLTLRRKSRRSTDNLPVSQIPTVSKEIKEVQGEASTNDFFSRDGILLTIHDKTSDKESDKVLVHLGMGKKNGDNSSSNQVPSIMLTRIVVGHNQEKKGVQEGCIEGTHRILVYEYVSNGNLEQWLHGAMRHHGYLTWEARMKVLLGTAKALAYLHENIEPKVVHRDIKSSNILIDDDFNAKVSDFGLAKLLGAGKSHITTRVMGTFGYVAPEYANTGLLNEKSDVYSFGVVLLESITGRDPVDYGRPPQEIDLVVNHAHDFSRLLNYSLRESHASSFTCSLFITLSEQKASISKNGGLEEVVDPNIETRPPTRALKRALLTALRCVDPDSDKRPKMEQDRRQRRAQAGNGESDSQNYDTDKSDNPDPRRFPAVVGHIPASVPPNAWKPIKRKSGVYIQIKCSF